MSVRRRLAGLLVRLLPASWLVSFALVLALAPAAGAAAEQPEEWLGRFHCAATLTVPGGAAVWTPCMSEDLPTKGYSNRWHYVLGPAAGQLLRGYVGRPPTFARICGAAVRGGMYQHAEGHWRLDMVPAAADVAKEFSKVAGASECRMQWFRVNALAEDYLELLIEEPCYLDPESCRILGR